MKPVTLGELLAQADPEIALTEAEMRVLADLLKQRNRTGRDMVHISDAVDDYVTWLENHAGERWPVIRRGERVPITNLVRLSIYSRDDHACRGGQAMHHTTDLELDHLIPWSAGGPDDSDNLRTLCAWCNARRSNFIDFAHGRQYRPTTWWCCECWTPDSAPRRVWKDGTDPNAVARIFPGDDWIAELVWCAHCCEYSYSPLFFVGSMGRELIERATWAKRHREATA